MGTLNRASGPVCYAVHCGHCYRVSEGQSIKILQSERKLRIILIIIT